MESNSIAIIVTSAVFVAIAGLSLVVRFWMRRITSVGLAADDWLATASFGFSAALAATNILGVPFGSFGSKFEMLDKNQAVAYLKFFFVIQFWYVAAVTAIKLTVLLLYKRIFSSPRTPTIIWVLIAVTVAWGISFITATLFQILPIWCNWVACPQTSNYPLMYLMSSITNLILDVVILFLPILFIRTLHMRLAKKIGVAGIFGLGLFCIVASTARLYYTYTYMQANIAGDYASNFDVSADNFIMWSALEACVSTICANLPTYGALFTRLKTHLRSQSSSGRRTDHHNHDSGRHGQPRIWHGVPHPSAHFSPSKWPPSPFSHEGRSLERLPSEDEGYRKIFRQARGRTVPGRQCHTAEITCPAPRRYSESRCPIDVEHDCHGVVHQVVEMSVVRTSNATDTEFCMLPCSPVEAVTRMA